MVRRRVTTVAAIVLLGCLLATSMVSAAPQRGEIIHVVQRGETLTGIARRYGVDMWALARANGVTNPSRIYVGQRLVIRTTEVPAPSGAVHVVRAGENLNSIAWRYGVDVWSIARANGIVNLNRIYVGQRLTIPGRAPSSPPSQPSQSPATSYPGPWTGEYFDNVSLAGSPYTTRTDESIAFDWAYGPPAGGMPTNAFSVRWSGTFWFEEGTYRFYAKVDDGVRVYVDDVLQINGWRDGSFRQHYKDVWLCAGDHSVRVEYYDRIQVAKAYAWWKAISGPAVATPTPTSTAAPPSGVWYGEYFNNKELQGTPVYRSHDAAIGFDWGAGRPSREVWHDGWSARWVTRVSLKNDHYRFCAMSDDGVRIWVNNQLVVDEWHANNGVAYCGAFWSSGGTYPVKVEYYEDGGNALLYVWWEPH